jgi:hypothetical protein
MGSKRIFLLLAAAIIAMIWVSVASADPPFGGLDVELLVGGLAGGSGSTIGPGGALYVPEPGAGRISRVDPLTGDRETFASGLPQAIIPLGPGLFLGGVMDVAFIGSTAYALVTLVSPDVGGSDIDGIYRIDGPDSFTVVADIGEFASSHPPDTDYSVPTGVQYAMEPYRGGFLVTDGHHNRVYRVTLDGRVREMIAFDNIVPTGLAVSGNRVYMAEAGPVPHMPEDGHVVVFGPQSSTARDVASGAPLLVDVEFGRGHLLYALSQGPGIPGVPAGGPAEPDTGSLVQVSRDGTLPVIVDGLDRPTSLEFIGNTAYVVTLPGDVWRIDGVSPPPYGVWP